MFFLVFKWAKLWRFSDHPKIPRRVPWCFVSFCWILSCGIEIERQLRYKSSNSAFRCFFSVLTTWSITECRFSVTPLSCTILLSTKTSILCTPSWCYFTTSNLRYKECLLVLHTFQLGDPAYSAFTSLSAPLVDSSTNTSADEKRYPPFHSVNKQGYHGSTIQPSRLNIKICSICLARGMSVD